MSRRTLLLLRWGVFVLACVFLFARVGDGGLDALVDARMDADGLWLAIGIALLLMPVNWGLESRKWRLLVRGLEPVSIRRAFAATLSGATIGLITPNRVGEFAGRVLFLAPENRVAGAFATVVGSIAQFVVTVALGMLGMIALSLHSRSEPLNPMLGAWVGLCALVAAAALVLYFNPGMLHALVARIGILRRWERQASVLNRFTIAQLATVLGLSALRYAVFTLQFVVLLRVCAGIPLLEALPAIPAIFLVSTLIPTVMLTELGVRGSVAVAALGAAPAHDGAVVLATTILWAVNIALPAMMGAVIMLVARITTADA